MGDLPVYGSSHGGATSSLRGRPIGRVQGLEGLQLERPFQGHARHRPRDPREALQTPKKKGLLRLRRQTQLPPLGQEKRTYLLQTIATSCRQPQSKIPSFLLFGPAPLQPKPKRRKLLS